VAASAGAGAVAVAHTADDQVETVLLHLVQGTGLRGLAGMRWRSAYPVPAEVQPCLVRPFLATRRSEVLAYLAAAGMPFRQDETNADPRFLRNRIRSRVVPELEALNPALAEAIGRLSAAAAEDLDLVDALTDAAWPAVRAEGPEALALDRESWLALAPALQRRLLRRMAAALAGGEPRAFGYDAVEAAREMIARRRAGRRSLPGGLELVVERDGFSLRRGGGRSG
jgi:tRNA(Ile)-lysidine synthase